MGSLNGGPAHSGDGILMWELAYSCYGGQLSELFSLLFIKADKFYGLADNF